MIQDSLLSSKCIAMSQRLAKDILIIGGGYIGLELHRQLVQTGFEADLIKRTPVPVTRGQVLLKDISKPFVLDKKYHIVFYLISPDHSSEAAYQKAYVNGVEESLAALSPRSEDARFLFCSSTAVYSENQGRLINEESGISQSHFRQKFLLGGEQLIRDSHFESVILRLSGIYGPGRDRLFQAAKNGLLTRKSGTFISNRIHRYDCAASMIHLAFQENPAPIYNISDSLPTDYNQVINWLAKKTNHKTPVPVDPDLNPGRLSNKKICNQRLLNSGYRFKFPDYRSGFLNLMERDSV